MVTYGGSAGRAPAPPDDVPKGDDDFSPRAFLTGLVLLLVGFPVAVRLVIVVCRPVLRLLEWWWDLWLPSGW